MTAARRGRADCNFPSGMRKPFHSLGPLVAALFLAEAASPATSPSPAPAAAESSPAGPPPNPQARKTSLRSDSLALFAGGPFWALEEAFEKVPGVEEAVVGYVPLPATEKPESRGKNVSAALPEGPSTPRGTAPGKAAPDTLPGFDAVVQGGTGHAFAVQVRFDPGRASYADLLGAYLRNIDPTARDRQFSDSGSQYRTLILTGGPAQEKEAKAALAGLARSGRFKAPLAVAVAPAEAFLPAEEGRQDHYRRYPGRYQAWLRLSGRTEGLGRLWGADGPSGRAAGGPAVRAGKTGPAGRAEHFPRGRRPQDSGRTSR